MGFHVSKKMPAQHQTDISKFIINWRDNNISTVRTATNTVTAHLGEFPRLNGENFDNKEYMAVIDNMLKTASCRIQAQEVFAERRISSLSANALPPQNIDRSSSQATYQPVFQMLDKIQSTVIMPLSQELEHTIISTPNYLNGSMYIKYLNEQLKNVIKTIDVAVNALDQGINDAYSKNAFRLLYRQCGVQPSKTGIISVFRKGYGYQGNL